MPQRVAHPEIVALLCNSTFKHFLGTWSHRDGGSFTPEERNLIFQATGPTSKNCRPNTHASWSTTRLTRKHPKPSSVSSPRSWSSSK